MEQHRFIFGDALEGMQQLEENSVDLICCDPPFGITDARWDTVIPMREMFDAVFRVLKPNRSCVLFACQPFSSMLVVEGLNNFYTEWIYQKQ